MIYALLVMLLVQLDPPLLEALPQRAPLELVVLDADVQPSEVLLSGRVGAAAEGVDAFAVGWLLIDPFDDAIAVSYSRMYRALSPGDEVEVGTTVRGTRASETVRVVGFVYAVRFRDGDLWKADLSVVATELLERYGVALPPTRLQP